MLATFRTKTGSFFSKIVFAIVAGSFALWGIGDMIGRAIYSERAPVKVGGHDIAAAEINEAFQRQVSRIRQQSRGQFTTEQAIQFGILDQVVEGKVVERLFELEAQRLGVEVGDDLLRRRIRQQTAFHDASGNFNSRRFLDTLRDNGLNEFTFARQFRQQLSSSLIAGAIAGGATVTKDMADVLQGYRGERRIGRMLTVAHASIADLPKPDEPTIEAYHKDNAARFSWPEMRALTMVTISPVQLADRVAIDEARLREEYERRASDYVTPERRSIHQLLFADEDAAKKAAAELGAGKAFEAIGKDALGQAAADLNLGEMAKSDLLPDVAEPVFQLTEGSVSAPLKSPFGWHIFRIDRIVPGSSKTFADVRDELRRELAVDQAQDLAYRTSVRLEDEVVGGGILQEAAAKLGLPLAAIEAVDRQGNGRDGRRVSELPAPSLEKVLGAAFSTKEGDNSPIVDLDDGSHVILRVDKIAPPALKPLTEVRAAVEAAWLAQMQAAKAQEKTEALLAKIKGGQDFSAAGQEAGITPALTEPVTRSRGPRPGGSPAEVGVRLFQMKTGDVDVVQTGSASIVVRLEQILPSDPATQEADTAELVDRLKRGAGDDLLTSFTEALRKRYIVNIDRAALDRMFQ
jgi:peptidyl-prolyl cis-trans isomerase D